MDTKISIITLMLAVVTLSAWAQESVSDNLAGDVEVAHVTTSSRLLMGEQKKEWIESMREKLAIANRATGPFGLTQDPNAKAVAPREKKAKKGAFLKAIGAIKINTVMPSDNKFTSRSREFSVGDQFPIIKNQRQFNIEVMEINTKGIVFKNVDTGEQVRKNLNDLPTGMKKSRHLDAIPGVFPADKKNAMPLDLDDEPSRVISR
jgi:hypothetical protein